MPNLWQIFFALVLVIFSCQIFGMAIFGSQPNRLFDLHLLSEVAELHSC
jgi:hypothetical protein